jgi:hypothetical protein
MWAKAPKRGLIERMSSDQKLRSRLDRLARKLRRPHRDATQRLEHRHAAEEAERNPRRGVYRGAERRRAPRA